MSRGKQKATAHVTTLLTGENAEEFADEESGSSVVESSTRSVMFVDPEVVPVDALSFLQSPRPVDVPVQGKIQTMQTGDIANYQLNQHVPKLHGRVVEITPNTPDADSGPGLLRIEADMFELRLAVKTPGLVDKPCEFTVTVEERTMAALGTAILKEMNLPESTSFVLSQRKKNLIGAEQWFDVQTIEDFQANAQNIIRIRDSEGCRNVYKKWHATIDKTPSVNWPVSDNASNIEQQAALYRGRLNYCSCRCPFF
jgi:hypothetical protein